MKIKIAPAIIFILSLFSLGFGQQIHSFLRPIDSLDSVKKGGFSSTEAGFSIDLPKDTGGFSGVSGLEYSWRLTEGYFSAGRIERETDIENSADLQSETLKIIDRVFADFAREYFATKFEVGNVEKKEVSVAGHKGLEVRITLTDTLLLIRVFWVKNRAYEVGVLLSPEQKKFEAEASRVFDSFKILAESDNGEIIRKKIEENTPEPLPQTPVAEKPRSDAEDAGLKGKVKTVFKDGQFIKGPKAGTPKRRDFEAYYNETGNLTKTVDYDDSNGLPLDITVYGYIDRNRVSKSGFIQYESSPGGIFIEEPESIRKRRDNRYHSKYKYKYDAAGNLIEKSTYGNGGEIWTRVAYRRKGKTVEIIVYDRSGQVNNRSLLKIDDRGNEIESSHFDSPVEGWMTTYTYAYEEFDKAGNWIKRTMTKSRTFQGITKEEWVMREFRTIVYY
ncbi:MAG: hypothetical protein R2747_00645 [Pyrinomonadaceae bacterium]